jgi:hypothetical protein
MSNETKLGSGFEGIEEGDLAGVGGGLRNPWERRDTENVVRAVSWWNRQTWGRVFNLGRAVWRASGGSNP